MPKSLFSSSWYRVANLKPRLRSHAEIHRQQFRGQLWYVLQDHASGRFHRFSPSAYLIVGLMDGERTVQEIWEIAGEKLGDDLPTQDEVVQLLGQLHSSDVLHCDVPPDVTEISYRSEKQRRSKLMQSIKNPMAMRLPLLDPDRFLSATLPVVRILFGPIGLVLWFAVIGIAAVLAGMHWSELTENITDRALATENILIMVFTYPFIKALHELGHGYAVKYWGGEVHEMGVMFLVFMPVPYVDASAATAFRDKWKRVVVGAAGVMVEMTLAAVALFVWLNAEPGMLRVIAFNAMLISGVSTVLFNGNPLLRFDGYYVLADILEIPNLGQRANQYIGYLIKSRLFKMEDLDSPASAPGEPAWFVIYGVAAFIYRIVIMIAIATFVATKFFFVGVLLAIWSLVMMYVVPAWKMIANLVNDPRIRRRRRRAMAVAGAAGAALAGIVALIPFPYATVAEGVVWVPDHSVIHAGADGVVARVVARPNASVRPGEALIVLEDPLLDAQVRVLQAELKELQLRYAAAWVADLVEAEIIRERINLSEAELDRAQKRAADLVIRSATGGRFLIPNVRNLPGTFVRRGETIGFVVEPANPVLRVVVAQSDIDLVREGGRNVEVRFVDRISKVHQAVIEREVPTGGNFLPSAALSVDGGGEFHMDPTDPNRSKALKTLFQIDLRLTTPMKLSTIGGRVYVRFDHGTMAIAGRVYRILRQIFLAKFNV